MALEPLRWVFDVHAAHSKRTDFTRMWIGGRVEYETECRLIDVGASGVIAMLPRQENEECRISVAMPWLGLAGLIRGYCQQDAAYLATPLGPAKILART